MTRPKPAPQAGYSKRSRLDKLGVKDGMRVALVGVEEAAIRRELAERTADVVEARPKRDTALILFEVDGPVPLARLASLAERMTRDGAIWVLWPKGQKHIKEDMVREAAKAQGLLDIKVMAFSERLSGLKLVIPVARR